MYRQKPNRYKYSICKLSEVDELKCAWNANASKTSPDSRETRREREKKRETHAHRWVRRGEGVPLTAYILVGHEGQRKRELSKVARELLDSTGARWRSDLRRAPDTLHTGHSRLQRRTLTWGGGDCPYWTTRRCARSSSGRSAAPTGRSRRRSWRGSRAAAVGVPSRASCTQRSCS